MKFSWDETSAGCFAEHLWQDPAHREEWLRLSELEGDLYSRFNYFLETDATLHLDDALKALQEIRDYQNLPEEQRQDPEHQREHERRGNARSKLLAWSKDPALKCKSWFRFAEPIPVPVLCAIHFHAIFTMLALD